jgi:hypothetical protein
MFAIIIAVTAVVFILACIVAWQFKKAQDRAFFAVGEEKMAMGIVPVSSSGGNYTTTYYGGNQSPYRPSYLTGGHQQQQHMPMGVWPAHHPSRPILHGSGGGIAIPGGSYQPIYTRPRG